MNPIGTLYGVSLGPGDPGLITRRAWELLQGKAWWTWPVRTEKSESYALGIIRAAGLVPPAGSEALVFPMTHNAEILAGAWARAAEAVLEKLHQGMDVLFLVEGDASTYSTFGPLARTVISLDANARVETVPGVSSFHAAAARLNMSLADTDDTMTIIPASYGIPVIDHLLDRADTLVLFKVKPLLDDIIDLLERRALLEHSVFVERVGAPEERIVYDVASLRDTTVHYLSLLLVKNPGRERGEMVYGCRRR
uniref:Precorrin-2 C20-methyltransferase /cobalt-factor II C20-methyltransferase n=1 Tax=Candidatus Kentrum sp. MB TaxID=2138164 RepID=A0A450XJB5_9GAMM|nr:MAG: precorrin-2 C20-methyltransferase /cobalt-factor II C20-methyltransferase [Candidatus Kentron sp. MB]VFK29377.1 MAG: precorrin-2 C20-methyltransferase /cobalt-factor II C20-methyltransferase [Candidatus Kentron sp. MB]VFK74768.1 MAG: precorrin-2 C20-methyltransferase /cobalt-factor II C20-methyltransferase [Candidatus Kentron sp. MB]